jgi:hypothetical protein
MNLLRPATHLQKIIKTPHGTQYPAVMSPLPPASASSEIILSQFGLHRSTADTTTTPHTDLPFLERSLSFEFFCVAFIISLMV